MFHFVEFAMSKPEDNVWTTLRFMHNIYVLYILCYLYNFLNQITTTESLMCLFLLRLNFLCKNFNLVGIILHIDIK